MSGAPRRRILLVVNWIGHGGAETQLRHLAAALRDAGHQVRMLAIQEIVADVRPLEEAGVELIALHATTRASKLRSVAAIARHARWAQVVHCTGWDASLWGRLGALLARRPMVVTEHTPGRHLQVTKRGEPRGRAIALHNRLLDPFTHSTVVVARWQAELLESEGVRAESIVRIPNAVPVARLRAMADAGPTRADLGIPEDSLVILHAARFRSQKGQSVTLRVGERLRGRLGDVRVLFAGSGSNEATVRQEAAALEADWAHFLGQRSDVPGLLRLSDLAVLPSSGEGLPMALIEAVVLGTPVVATDVGDVRWLLEMSRGGICVPPGDENAFAEACARVLDDADLRNGFGGAADRAAEEFDVEKMARRYERVLEAAIASRERPPEAAT